ncbi:hypothetical protein PENSPDRAFT_492104 [Peniophora sp. CONT]|nr:hypothetical protein PENSPDRAFT_492104 [Peniophora sp. CONT]
MPCLHAAYACPSSLAHALLTAPLRVSASSCRTAPFWAACPASNCPLCMPNLLRLATSICQRYPRRTLDARTHACMPHEMVFLVKSSQDTRAPRNPRSPASQDGARPASFVLARRPRSPRVQYCQGPGSSTHAVASLHRRHGLFGPFHATQS